MEYIHKINLLGRDVTMTWVGQTAADPARVYALAFTSEHDILLVSGGVDDPYRWLPGGGIEAGESPEQALRRELLEEADAAVVALEYLGSQRLDDAGGWQEYQHFYWCRVTLAPQDAIRLETTLRHLVSRAKFLDTLEWGRSDPKAAMLLERALEVEWKYQL
jgi:ADP-ribose pyrophosphatase YjhB (NUDIX family)